MGRKKKDSRKYEPRNEFRVNNSPLAKGHVNYVFGETKTKYKSMGLTHTPKSNIKHIRLKQNPNPDDKRVSYLQPKVQTAKKSYYGKTLVGWNFCKEDQSIVRHYKKQYKKSINRKPPGYYEQKNKKK